MKRSVKSALILGSIGFVCGILIGLTFFICSDVYGAEDRAAAFAGLSLFELLVGGIYGMISMGLTVVYDIESWSIAKATITHFAFTLAGFYAMGMIQGWLVLGDLLFWIMTAAFIAVYICIWLSQYLSYRRQIRRMNDGLDQFKKQ
ncbi:MAG: DUF3021 domain-containing protein [Lachnospiraceae bacterium]|nr:DUF3021 domain-containing protein [Lachnospiraceae bacterium]